MEIHRNSSGYVAIFITATVYVHVATFGLAVSIGEADSLVTVDVGIESATKGLREMDS